MFFLSPFSCKDKIPTSDQISPVEPNSPAQFGSTSLQGFPACPVFPLCHGETVSEWHSWLSPLFHSGPSASKLLTKPYSVNVGVVTSWTHRWSRAGLGLLPYSAEGLSPLEGWCRVFVSIRSNTMNRLTRYPCSLTWAMKQVQIFTQRGISVFCTQPDLCWCATDFCSQLLITRGTERAKSKSPKPLFVNNAVSHWNGWKSALWFCIHHLRFIWAGEISLGLVNC